MNYLGHIHQIIGDEPVSQVCFEVDWAFFPIGIPSRGLHSSGDKDCAQGDDKMNRGIVEKLKPEALLQNIRPVAWFDNDQPLRSGWAWGQHYLDGGLAVIEAGIGKGKLFIFGPEIAYRGQPHGTFKFLFNGIYYGSSNKIVLKGN